MMLSRCKSGGNEPHDVTEASFGARGKSEEERRAHVAGLGRGAYTPAYLECAPGKIRTEAPFLFKFNLFKF